MQKLNRILGIQHPIIMAPMFLVTNINMMQSALNVGIAACVPALNFRTYLELEQALHTIRNNTQSSGLGVNLIASNSNPKLEKQLEICLKTKVDFIITSLGSPAKIIEQAHDLGIKVFCDITEENYAAKVIQLGADAVIAVNKFAGGHAGNLSSAELISRIRTFSDIPIISAGGVGDYSGVQSKLAEGFCGLSIGSPFIASEESSVAMDYKNACVEYGKEDIVMTTKISGTPCTIINTPYVQQVGTTQNFLEKILAKNKTLKKWIRMLTYFKGMKQIEKAAFSSTYKTVWCAGPSIEYTKKIEPIWQIVMRLTTKN